MYIDSAVSNPRRKHSPALARYDRRYFEESHTYFPGQVFTANITFGARKRDAELLEQKHYRETEIHLNRLKAHNVKLSISIEKASRKCR